MTTVLPDTEREQLGDALRGVEGWLTEEESQTLYGLARACSGRGAIVELGSWKGRSTVSLALGSKAGAGAPVYAIDRPRGEIYADFERNIRRAGVEDLVRPINSSSEEAAAGFDGPIELLFIDASHEYELVARDWELWVPRLVEGGVLAMHDTTWFEGPKRIAEERMYLSNRFKDVRFVFSSTTVGRKVAANSRADRARNLYALLVKRSFELAARGRRLIPKPLESAGRRLLRIVQ